MSERIKGGRPRNNPPAPGKLLAKERLLLLEGIKSLPDVQANVLILHYIKNKPLSAVAESLKISPAQVTQAHDAGLKHLRTLADSK